MRRLGLLVLTTGLLTLFGCANEEEVIDQLKMDAEKHEELGKREEAILLYEKVLNMENDPDVVERVQQLRADQE